MHNNETACTPGDEQEKHLWGQPLPAPRPLTPERRQAILEAEKQGLTIDEYQAV